MRRTSILRWGYPLYRCRLSRPSFFSRPPGSLLVLTRGITTPMAACWICAVTTRYTSIQVAAALTAIDLPVHAACSVTTDNPTIDTRCCKPPSCINAMAATTDATNTVAFPLSSSKFRADLCRKDRREGRVVG